MRQQQDAAGLAGLGGRGGTDVVHRDRYAMDGRLDTATLTAPHAIDLARRLSGGSDLMPGRRRGSQTTRQAAASKAAAAYPTTFVGPAAGGIRK